MNNVKPLISITQKIFKPWLILTLLSLALLIALSITWSSSQNVYHGLYCSTKLNSHETRNKKQIDAILDASIYFKNNDKGSLSLYGIFHDGVQSTVISRDLDFDYEQDGKFLLLTNIVVRKSGTDTAPDNAITFGTKQTLRVEQLFNDDILISTTFIPTFICSKKEGQRVVR